MSKKLDCKFRKKINAYLDNELNETEFIQVKNHLLECSICQAEIRTLNKLNELLNNYQEEVVPDAVIDNILVAVSAVSKTNLNRKNKLIRYLAVASVAASFTIGLIFSSISFQNSTDSLSDYSLGQESLYSYYVTE